MAVIPRFDRGIQEVIYFCFYWYFQNRMGILMLMIVINGLLSLIYV